MVEATTQPGRTVREFVCEGALTGFECARRV